MRVDVVIPTVGRASLWRLLRTIDRCGGNPFGRVIVVDDRTPGSPALGVPDGVEVVHSRGAGPAAARNRGWHASDADWIAFLDDDTELTGGWFADLERDLAVPQVVAGSQGRVAVPRPAGRRPTDAERNVIGLEQARFASADICYRRSVLRRVGGFDERFPRAYREDADLALRVLGRGCWIETGRRITVHPLGSDQSRTAIRRQAGNRDDVLMWALHGGQWRARAGAPRGRLRRHLATTVLAALAPAALAAGRPAMAGLAAAGWTASTAEFAWARIAPGPRTRREVADMVVTSAVIPPVAVAQAAVGVARLPRNLRSRPTTVLFDRDGTLIVNVPYNGDPAQVRPMPRAGRALLRLRTSGIRTGVVSNQSGVARGLISDAQVDAVNREVERQLGPLGPWFVCPHAPDAGCDCRKPAAGLVEAALARLAADRRRTVLVGDTAADMEAARRAGVRAVLVPNRDTLPAEVAAAPEVASDLNGAVDLILGAA